MKKSSDSSGSMVVRRLAILAAACLAWSLLGAASLWAQRPLTEKHVRELGKYLDGVQIAEPIAYRQLSVYPILVEDEPLLRGRWLTLDKAISRGILEVGEKAGGSVPVVRVRNKSRDENVLIMTGEVVAGGMQTRTIRHDVVLAPRQTIDLDVFCVEAHRWSGEEKFSGGSKVMLPQSIQGKVREGADQGKVWSEVARNNSSLRAENSTGSLEKALNSGHVRRRLEEARRKIVPEIPSGTVGFIFVGNGRALGAELFGSEDLRESFCPSCSIPTWSITLSCATRTPAAARAITGRRSISSSCSAAAAASGQRPPGRARASARGRAICSATASAWTIRWCITECSSPKGRNRSRSSGVGHRSSIRLSRDR